MSSTKMRRQWLTSLIREVHDASRKTYESRRVHAELTRGMGIAVSVNLVGELMRLAGIAGLPGPVEAKRLKGVATADDLVHRKFHRLSPNELWVTDITEHPTPWVRAVVATPIESGVRGGCAGQVVGVEGQVLRGA